MGSSPHSRAGVINPNETTPWLQHTRWPDLFRNRSLEVISTTAQQPDFVQGQDYLLGKWKESSVESSAEAEAQLRILLHGVDIMFNRVMATMARTSYTSRCWLNTYSRNDFWPHPFRAVLCLKRYISVWKRLICFVFRVLGFKERQRQQLYNFKLGLKEEKMMHYILFLASQLPSREQGHSRRQPVEDDELSHASSDESDGETDFEEDASIGIDDSSQYQSEFLLPSRPWLELSEALFQLSMMFWTHQDPAGDMSSSVIIYYTAVMGIQRRSMSYYPAHNSTGGLAALMWVGRVLFLEYALPLYSYTTLAYHWPSRDQYHSQPERLEAIRQRYLVRGCYTPFGELIELKAFAKSIVRQEGMPGNLSWAPDGRSFVVGNDKEVKLSDFCKTYHKAIALVEEQVEEMMLGLKPNFNLDIVRDDLNCRKAGWSFLQKPENKLSDAREMLINKLRTSQFRGKPFATASHWCPDTCLAYLNLGLDLNKSAFAALQISGGLPGRGSEVTSIRCVNTELTMRNVFFYGGRMIIVISYNKARASNNYSFYIVRYLPANLSLSLLKYLAMIRPTIDFLSTALKMPHYKCNEFLFQDPSGRQKHLSSAQASGILKYLTRDLVTPWTLFLYRQASLAISKRKGADKVVKRCTWREPGNFNSNLSALTWTAQLILFDFVCFQKQDDEDGIPDLLDQMCKKYFQQMAETPFGHVLQWRLYLFAASRTSLTKHQARWSLDGETVDYMGTKLHMEQVTQLVESEFRQAHSLLYNELLFGMRDVAPIEAWRLHDDLDVDDYGASWLTDERNREILAGTHDALLRQIEERADLRQVFVRLGPNGGVRLCPKAIAIYEAHVQEFLKRMLALISVPSGPPLRSPELLSITYINTGARRRSVFLWEKMVMIYVRYSKSQEQTGEEKDNIRFLPPAVGNLLLTYLAFVLPLRQAFLRQSKPGALLSPYLWSKLGGEVWRDGMVSSCLRRACMRAEVPQFQVAWWRQVAASITKEKFSAREQANFDMGEIAASEEVEDEADLAYLAGMSNHSFRTFNYSYAGSTTLTVTSSLHRAYRASQSWRSLFRIDQVLQGKRPPAVSDTQAQGLLNACKKVRFRARPAAKEDGITAAARRLHNDPELQLRRPGQRDAMLATMGPRAPEQVIVVLATGSGKTLVFMVGATLAGAETTILILPTVALRGNMLGRLDKVALKHHIWRPGSKKSAPIVVVSAEAACTEAFLEYANRLSDRQCLDRIVIDECHLTITASCYRRSMSQLAWHVRQIRTQTVWLTATLPPIYQELFFEHNKLVRPHIIRESTNRPNIRYIVQQERGLGNLCEQAACLVQSCWTRTDLFKSERDRVIIYCPTKDLVAELADMLGCPSYTAESGTEEEKMAIIERWLTAADSPIIVATSALGPGFDYPHIRLVIHVDAPSLLTDFSQELRDETEAGQDGDNGSADLAVSEMIFTGPAEVLRQDQVRDEELSRYERDLETMKGCCLYCRVEGKSFEHTVTACARRFDWIRAKQKALRDCQSKKKEWMDRHAVCWKCYQPQEICRAADPEYEGDNSCQYPDMVMPLCFGAFSRPGRTKWFLKHFNESFKTCQEYMLWLGKGASLGGSRCVNANCVAALLLGEFE
ncbi:hypothetical protein FOBRF1_007201 [Fusarium oxysporum]